jgi:hypothetical protein
MKGCVTAPVRPVTVEQMEAAIADAVADRTLQ